LCEQNAQAMIFEFKTIHEFNDFFQDEVTCYQFLEEQRWQGVPVCPHCASAKAPYKVKARGKFQDIPSYRCSERACDLPFTVRTGSIFEGSKVELRKWFQAAYEISTSKKGISSVELGTRIGVSQKTAWFINHRIRTMLSDSAPEILEGIVEADETFVGGKNKNRHENKKVANSQGRSGADKTAVVGILQREGGVKTFVVKDTSAETLQSIMVENVASEAVVITDAYQSYKGLEKIVSEHISIKHTEGNYKTVGYKHTNNIEGFWSQLKRGVIGTYHYVSPQHLQRYCFEFETRYNQRDVSNIQRFIEVLKSSDKDRIRYIELTSAGK
jgi:transposase-like protein